MNIIDIGLFIILASGVYMAIALVRIEMASKIRMRRLEEIHIACVSRIRARQDWRELFTEFENGPSFNQVAFDLTKWTVRSVYKDLPK